MSSAQDLRKRIKSVTNTQQITKAMKMVASARLRRAQAKAKSTEPYAKKLGQILTNVSATLDAEVLASYPLTMVRDVSRTCYILIGADKGLAGAYTSNFIKYFAHETHEKASDTYETITVGRKPTEYLQYHQYPVTHSHVGFSDKPDYSHAKQIVQEASKLFLDGEVDEVILIYTHFVNSLTQNVTSVKLLPVITEPHHEGELNELYIYEPSEKAIYDQLLPKYLEITVYNALLQASASELGARMTAMTSATDNAGDLISTLNLEYNKLRQAGITNEISEIVGGANALQ